MSGIISPALNPSSGGSVEIQETIPTDPTKNNPSTVLSYDGSGNLQYIDQTIGAHVYRTTLTYSGTTLTGVSAAVQTS